MGVGTNRIRRLQNGAPDLRYGTREYRSKAGTWTIDGFLQVAYDNIAETLPDRLPRSNTISFFVVFCFRFFAVTHS